MKKWEIAEVAADQAALNAEYYAPNDLNEQDNYTAFDDYFDELDIHTTPAEYKALKAEFYKKNPRYAIQG